MNKVLLILTLLFAPNFAKAQNNQQKINNQLEQAYKNKIYQMAEKFFPIACKEKLPKAIETVKQCYQKTPDNSPDIIFCLITDKYIVRMAKENDKFTEMYSQDIINFINDYKKRLKLHSAIELNPKKNSIEKLDEIMTRASVDFSVNINDLYTLADLNKEHCIKNEFSENGFID